MSSRRNSIEWMPFRIKPCKISWVASSSYSTRLTSRQQCFNSSKPRCNSRSTCWLHAPKCYKLSKVKCIATLRSGWFQTTIASMVPWTWLATIWVKFLKVVASRPSVATSTCSIAANLVYQSKTLKLMLQMSLLIQCLICKHPWQVAMKISAALPTIRKRLDSRLASIRSMNSMYKHTISSLVAITDCRTWGASKLLMSQSIYLLTRNRLALMMRYLIMMVLALHKECNTSSNSRFNNSSNNRWCSLPVLILLQPIPVVVWTIHSSSSITQCLWAVILSCRTCILIRREDHSITDSSSNSTLQDLLIKTSIFTHLHPSLHTVVLSLTTIHLTASFSGCILKSCKLNHLFQLNKTKTSLA